MSSFIPGMVQNTRKPQEAYNPIEQEQHTRSNSKTIKGKGRGKHWCGLDTRYNWCDLRAQDLNRQRGGERIHYESEKNGLSKGTHARLSVKRSQSDSKPRVSRNGQPRSSMSLVPHGSTFIVNVKGLPWVCTISLVLQETWV